MLFKSIGLTALLLTYSSAQLSVNSGKLTILDSAGISQINQEFSSTSPSPIPLTQIDPSNVLQLNFLVTDGENPIQPHQAMIIWEPVDPKEKLERGRDHSSFVKVRKGGKGKWELDFSRAPNSLLAISTGPISATLLIATFSQPGLSIPLGTFQLSPSLSLPFPYPGPETLPKAWEVEKYAKMPKIEWTFRDAEKVVGTPVAIAGLLFVLSPWVVLVGIASHLKPTLSSPTINILSFLLCIVSFESLIVLYWTSLTLIPTLPYFGLLALLTAFTGRRALGDMRKNRLIRESKAKKSL